MRCSTQFYDTKMKRFGRDYGSRIQNPAKLLDKIRKVANAGDKLFNDSRVGYSDVTDDDDKQACDNFDPIANDRYKDLFCNGYDCDVSLSDDQVRKFLNDIQRDPNYPGKAPLANSPWKKKLQDRGLWPTDRQIYPDTDGFMQRLYDRAHDPRSFFD